MKVYDHVISLGYNCEVSAEIERHFGTVDSHVFTWAHIEKPEGLINCLKNMNALFVDGTYVSDRFMYACNHYDIGLHGTILLDKCFNGDPNTLTPEEAIVDLEEIMAKLQHLKDKFRKVLDSDDKILFIHKPKEISYSYLMLLYKTIKELSSTSELLIIADKGVHLSFDEEKGIYLRGVNFFAPDSNVFEGDHKSWDEIFKEFVWKKEGINVA